MLLHCPVAGQLRLAYYPIFLEYKRSRAIFLIGIINGVYTS
jgi:hypothetical protein